METTVKFSNTTLIKSLKSIFPEEVNPNTGTHSYQLGHFLIQVRKPGSEDQDVRFLIEGSDSSQTVGMKAAQPDFIYRCTVQALIGSLISMEAAAPELVTDQKEGCTLSLTDSKGLKILQVISKSDRTIDFEWDSERLGNDLPELLKKLVD